MTLWIIFVLLCLLALAFVVWPLYRSSARLTPLLATVIVLVVGSSTLLYNKIGSPNVPSGAGSSPEFNEIISSLAKRLEANPDDVNGWLMLGRSYRSMGQFGDAIAAFEKALQLEQGQNAQTMVVLGVTLMENQGGQMSDRSSSLFENALALEPNNQNALFYAGSAAERRGDLILAADRWETLLGLNPPPDIQEMLTRKISEWRGHPPIPSGMAEAPAAQPAPAGMGQAQVAQPTQAGGDAIVTLSVSLSEDAKAALPADATVYVIARDQAMPSPPIAVAPRRLSQLPTIVELSDVNAMVAGRPLSLFSEFEVVVRVSLSGSPAAQPGDWFGSLIATANSGQIIDLVIDQKVP
ncbi:MAG: tetratricopeptide repeat protein [Gammaproteobacteria bacterium]|nr:tetratricopeptide repeat protein [Gammaproteobacteria bacterium]